MRDNKEFDFDIFELLKALECDLNQYEKGFQDAKKNNMKDQKENGLKDLMMMTNG